MRTPFIRHLLSYVASQGGDAAGLAGRFGLDLAAAVRAGDSPADAPELELAAIGQLAEAAAELLGEPDLGLRLSCHVPRGSYQVIDLVTETAPTLGEALDRLLRYQRLINSAVLFSCERRGDQVAIEHRVPGAPGCVGLHGNEYTLALLVRRCRELTSTFVSPLRAWVAHGHTPNREALAQALGTGELQLDAGANGLLLPAGVLELPVTTSDAAMLRAMDHYANLLVAAAPLPDELGAQVAQQIVQALREGAVDVERIASRLHLSVRTMQRRLEEVGTTFQDVLEEVRRSQALRQVVDPRLATGEVAYLLGYSDPRNFQRAFKRWTGMTPSQYRGAARLAPDDPSLAPGDGHRLEPGPENPCDCSPPRRA